MAVSGTATRAAGYFPRQSPGRPTGQIRYQITAKETKKTSGQD
ncbi:hypothetical protein [Peptoclostridium litorale]|nr:hypothetical protein [Peptoclostridium litorale]